ncbi:UPF0324 membrane protein [Massilia varians]|uniref:UPF0324 membrane protein n=1 Tax=Massilia varians TaxID=457921 RepID=A0ABM8CBX0_9BURK|nr:UPF0324 membrane protein [Massilia varians]
MKACLPVVASTLPGLLMCGAITALAYALEHLEAHFLGRAWLESLVLAILLGTGVRTLYRLDARFEPGIRVGAKLLLEIAVVLLGASVSAATLLEHGLGLVAGIALVVAAAIVLSVAIGRSVGLSDNMALLIACGNAICGNSAIAAVAPVIDADGNDVAAAIAFTAVLGVAVVLGLPLLVDLLAFTPAQYGVFAGLTVYAVPQVLAATAPVSAASVQIGTVVKLVRVLMLGPVVLLLSLGSRGRRMARPSLPHLLPWFIVGFLLMLCLRSLGWIPQAALPPAQRIAGFLTIMSMAALGLGVDARAVAGAGARVVFVVLASLLGLGLISFLLVKLLQV